MDGTHVNHVDDEHADHHDLDDNTDDDHHHHRIMIDMVLTMMIASMDIQSTLNAFSVNGKSEGVEIVGKQSHHNNMFSAMCCICLRFLY